MTTQQREAFLNLLWVNDHIEMTFKDLLRAIKCNGFHLVGMTSKRLILESIQ